MSVHRGNDQQGVAKLSTRNVSYSLFTETLLWENFHGPVVKLGVQIHE
jgi:hypothetical protein